MEPQKGFFSSPIRIPNKNIEYIGHLINVQCKITEVECEGEEWAETVCEVSKTLSTVYQREIGEEESNVNQISALHANSNSQHRTEMLF